MIDAPGGDGVWTFFLATVIGIVHCRHSALRNIYRILFYLPPSLWQLSLCPAWQVLEASAPSAVGLFAQSPLPTQWPPLSYLHIRGGSDELAPMVRGG
jgi:hypothetical protein